MKQKIKASIVGVSGYTGLELLRLLLAHPRVEIGYLTSRQHEKEPIGNLYPHLAHLPYDVTDTKPEKVAKESDVVFLCLPHKTAQDVVASLHGKTKLIDLSADFRLDDPAAYEKYYEKHGHPDLLKEVVYGAPEITPKEKIAKADTVANPGCFALLSQLLLFPFKGHIEHADIFAVTGSSGAGKTPGEGTHHPIRNHNMRSYNVNKHRHIPEITRTAEIGEDKLNFTPTSGPFTRGIFAQAYITMTEKGPPSFAPSLERGDKAGTPYENAPFIRLQKEVTLAGIVGSNFADLSFATGKGGRILAQGALDNIVKGAGGNAIQNMNLMFGFDETEGLINLGTLYP